MPLINFIHGKFFRMLSEILNIDVPFDIAIVIIIKGNIVDILYKKIDNNVFNNKVLLVLAI